MNQSLRKLHQTLLEFEINDIPAEDGSDELLPRAVIAPFVKLPSKRDYGDYYMIIKSPICMNNIDKKIKKEEYKKLSDMKSDIDLLCNNCRTYNDDASLLYADANRIEVSSDFSFVMINLDLSLTMCYRNTSMNFTKQSWQTTQSWLPWRASTRTRRLDLRRPQVHPSLHQLVPPVSNW